MNKKNACELIELVTLEHVVGGNRVDDAIKDSDAAFNAAGGNDWGAVEKAGRLYAKEIGVKWD